MLDYIIAILSLHWQCKGNMIHPSVLRTKPQQLCVTSVSRCVVAYSPSSGTHVAEGFCLFNDSRSRAGDRFPLSLASHEIVNNIIATSLQHYQIYIISQLNVTTLSKVFKHIHSNWEGKYTGMCGPLPPGAGASPEHRAHVALVFPRQYG